MPACLRPLLAGLLLGCTGCGPASSESPAEPARAQELYVSWNCGACHGEAGQGTEFGPPLRDLDRSWDVSSLAAHLADPEARRAEDPRLRALASRFPAPMPGYTEPERDRRLLAAWLLARKSSP